MSQTISIDNATLASLDAAASLRNMTREDTLRDAIDHLAEYDAWFRAKVDGGEKAYREGRFISQDESTQRAQQRRFRLMQKFGQ